MHFWKDREGNKLTFKEFLARWKTGLQAVTPLQQVVWQMWSTWIILIGIVCGIVISCFAFKQVWWLTIILIGAFFNTSVQMLGLWQKASLLKSFTFNIKDIENDKVNGEDKVNDKTNNNN